MEFEGRKLMDCGTAFFAARDLEEAVGKVAGAMARAGGTPRRTGPDRLLLDASTVWRERCLLATVEPSGDGYAASFAESSLGKPFFVLWPARRWLRRIRAVRQSL